MKSHEVVWYTVDFISTLHLNRKHISPIYGRMIYCWGPFKISKQKVIELWEWDHDQLFCIDSPHALLFHLKRRIFISHGFKNRLNRIWMSYLECLRALLHETRSELKLKSEISNCFHLHGNLHGDFTAATFNFHFQQGSNAHVQMISFNYCKLN